MKTKKLLILLVIILFATPFAFAQYSGRQFIKEKISEQGGCRNVAITKTNGDLMLNGRNYWAASHCPSGLTEALDELASDGEYIDDVQLTENGSWLILYGNNGLQWSNIPYDLEQKLREYNRKEEVITSVSFNDDGDWIVVTKNYVAASSDVFTEWLSDGMEEYGELWTTCITDDALVAVFQNGYKFLGDVPSSLKDKLRATNMNVYRLKIAGTSWFFSDGKSNYSYNM